MASVMDFAREYLSVRDKATLRTTSRSAAYDPRSLQERLLAMTLRANDAMSQLDQMTLQFIAQLRRDDGLQANLESVRGRYQYALECSSRDRELINTLYRYVSEEDRARVFGLDRANEARVRRLIAGIPESPFARRNFR